MGLLKSIWDGFGDLYDSLENSSNNNYNEDNSYNNYNEHYEDEDRYERRQVRRSGPPKVHVRWRGYYQSVTGLWTPGEWEGDIPNLQWCQLQNDGKAISHFLKIKIGDVEKFEHDLNYLEFCGYVD